MHFNRLALHFLLSFAIIANGMMISTSNAHNHPQTTVNITSANNISHPTATIHAQDNDGIEHQHAKNLASDTHDQHVDLAGKCHGKACKENCDCGCGMGFCLSAVATLIVSQQGFSLLKCMGEVPPMSDNIIAVVRSTSPLRPPIA